MLSGGEKFTGQDQCVSNSTISTHNPSLTLYVQYVKLTCFVGRRVPCLLSQSDIAVKNQIQDLGSLDLDWGHHDIHHVVHFKIINVCMKQSSEGVINYFSKLSFYFAMKTRCDFSCLCIFLLQIMILSFKIWVVLTEPSTSSEEAHPEISRQVMDGVSIHYQRLSSISLFYYWCLDVIKF